MDWSIIIFLLIVAAVYFVCLGFSLYQVKYQHWIRVPAITTLGIMTLIFLTVSALGLEVLRFPENKTKNRTF
jgi:hypothetical protein